MSYDVRAIANFVLDLADERGRAVSNLSINKIVYFLHANYLARFDRPLVPAKIDAWNYGPVLRELYREFKKFDDRPISGRAYRISPETGTKELCQCNLPEEERKFLEELGREFVGFKTSTLIGLFSQLARASITTSEILSENQDSIPSPFPRKNAISRRISSRFDMAQIPPLQTSTL